MATTSKAFARTSFTVALSTVYTVPAGTTSILTNIAITNTTSSAQTVAVFIGGLEIIGGGASVAGNSTAFFDLKQVMNAGDKIELSGSSVFVRFHASGVEVA